MYRSLLRCCLAVCLMLCTVALTAAEWQYSLYRAGGGWWRGRIRIAVANKTPRAVDGRPAVVRIGGAAGEADLAGQRAEAVRLCNEQGIEMLFAIYGPHENPIVRGPIPGGSTLVFPVECKKQQSAVYYVYFDNPDAGEVPDFLTARPSLVNGDVEQGDSPADSGDAPAGWTHDSPNAHHRASWTTENPQSGKRCLKTVVDEGAPPTWIATRQGDIAILGGARYRISAWVKAENVKGIAGWYIQVGTAEKPVLVAPPLAGGEGTYGWKEVSAEFTATVEANLASLGTILHGTGTAWFDNVRLECLEPVPLKAIAEKPERLTLTDAGEIASDMRNRWQEYAGTHNNDYDHRVAVRLFNGSQETIGKRLFTVDAAMVAARSRWPGRVPGDRRLGQTDHRQLCGRSAAFRGRRARSFGANVPRVLARRPGLPAAGRQHGRQAAARRRYAERPESGEESRFFPRWRATGPLDARVGLAPLGNRVHDGGPPASFGRQVLFEDARAVQPAQRVARLASKRADSARPHVSCFGLGQVPRRLGKDCHPFLPEHGPRRRGLFGEHRAGAYGRNEGLDAPLGNVYSIAGSSVARASSDDARHGNPMVGRRHGGRDGTGHARSRGGAAGAARINSMSGKCPR